MKTQKIDRDLQNADRFCINAYIVDYIHFYNKKPTAKDIKENWQYQYYIASHYNYSDSFIENIIDKICKYYLFN